MNVVLQEKVSEAGKKGNGIVHCFETYFSAS